MHDTLTAEPLVRMRCRLAEGPIWDERAGLLYWVDIEGGRVHRLELANKALDTMDFGKRVGCIALHAQGGYLAGLEDGLAHLDRWNGSLTYLHHPEAHIPHNRFNDGKTDPAGRFWIGSMSRIRQEGAGSLYRLDCDGGISAVFRGVTISNGMAWHGRTMYYIDSPTKRIDAFDYDPESGVIEPGSRRTAVSIDGGEPDGMTIDRNGNLWVAVWGGGRVSCFDPRGGGEIRRVSVEASQVSSCCFGGPDLDRLFITTASEELGPGVEPLAGSIFVARTEALGLPPSRCRCPV